MRFTTNEQKQQELLRMMESASAQQQVPLSALKAHRESASMNQSELARRSGVVQEQVNRMESHKRPMSAESAARLAPALGVDAGDLMLGHHISALKAKALSGRLSPTAMLDAITSLDEALPESEVGEQLMGALMQVLSDAVASYNEADGKADAKPKAATKSASARAESRRTGTGTRKDKPYARRDD